MTPAARLAFANGTSFGVEGVPIAVDGAAMWDGTTTFDPDFEAVWTPRGASCVSSSKVLALIASIPVAHPRLRQPRMRLAGDLPSALAPPPGCAFHTRCAHAGDACRSEVLLMRHNGPNAAWSTSTTGATSFQ